MEILFSYPGRSDCGRTVNIFMLLQVFSPKSLYTATRRFRWHMHFSNVLMIVHLLTSSDVDYNEFMFCARSSVVHFSICVSSYVCFPDLWFVPAPEWIRVFVFPFIPILFFPCLASREKSLGLGKASKSSQSGTHVPTQLSGQLGYQCTGKTSIKKSWLSELCWLKLWGLLIVMPISANTRSSIFISVNSNLKHLTKFIFIFYHVAAVIFNKKEAHPSYLGGTVDLPSNS